MAQDTSKTRGTMFTVISILFLDIVGFSIIFPLFPAMLTYYLGNSGQDGIFLREILNSLDRLIPAQGATSVFLSTVLFGGVLGSLYGVLQFIFSPILGRLSDKVGRRLVLIVTVLGNTLGYILWIFSGSFVWLIVSRIVCGAMAGNLSVATAAVADITTQENRARGMAMVGVAFGLGFILGPAIGALAAHYDLTQFFPQLLAYGLTPFSTAAIAATVLSILNFILCIYCLKETLPLKPRVNQGVVVIDSSLESQVLECLVDEPHPILSHRPSIKRVVNINFFYCFINGAMEFTITFLALERLAFGPTKNGIMFVYLGLIMILSQGMIVRRFAHKIGEKRMASIGCIFGLMGYFCTALSHSVPVFFIALTFLGIGASFCYPSLSALVSMYSNEHEQGRYLGSYRSAGALGRALGPLCGALIYFYFGSTINYYIGSILLLIPFLMLLPLPTPDSVKMRKVAKA